MLCLLCMMVKHQGLIHFKDPLERSCKVISPICKGDKWFISKAARRGGCRAQPWPRVFVWYVQVSQQGDTYWQRGILWARKPLPFKLGYPSKSHIAKVSHHSKWLKSTEKAFLRNHSVLYPCLVLDQIPPTQQDQHECNKLPWSDWLGTKFSKPSLMRKSKNSFKSLFRCLKSHVTHKLLSMESVW